MNKGQGLHVLLAFAVKDALPRKHVTAVHVMVYIVDIFAMTRA